MPQVELSTTISGNMAVVAASTAPANTKRVADYVCDGTDDHVQIQQALDDNQVTGSEFLGGIALTGGTFSVRDSIELYRGQTITGAGAATRLRADSDFGAYMLILNDPGSTNAVTISNLMLDGNYQDVGGVLLDNSPPYNYPDPVPTHPDAVHTLLDLIIRDMGSGGGPQRHGVWLYSDSSGGGARGSHLVNVQCRAIKGDAFRMESSSDNKFLNCVANTNRSGGGHGFNVAGGSCEFTMCKAFFTELNGFELTSSRPQLANCNAQDCGGWGYNVETDATVSGSVADSNGRNRSGGNADAGFRIAGNDVMLNGCRAVDRNKSANRQLYGFRYVSGNDVWVTGTSKDNVTADYVGNFAGISNRKIDILGSDGHFISNS